MTASFRLTAAVLASALVCAPAYAQYGQPAYGQPAYPAPQTAPQAAGRAIMAPDC